MNNPGNLNCRRRNEDLVEEKKFLLQLLVFLYPTPHLALVLLQDLRLSALYLRHQTERRIISEETRAVNQILLPLGKVIINIVRLYFRGSSAPRGCFGWKGGGRGRPPTSKIGGTSPSMENLGNDPLNKLKEKDERTGVGLHCTKDLLITTCRRLYGLIYRLW